MTNPPAAPVPPLDDVILTGLRARFPGWSIHRSWDGRWHATRRDVLPPSRQPPHYAPALTAQNPRFLAQAISRQPGRPRSSSIANPRDQPPWPHQHTSPASPPYAR